MALAPSVTKEHDEMILEGCIHDDYDPREARFILPATNDEIMQGEVDLKIKQIASLHSLIVRLDSQEEGNPNVLLYQEALENLQRECKWGMDSKCCLPSSSRKLSESSSSTSLQGASSDNESMLCSRGHEPLVHLGEFDMQDFEECPPQQVPSMLIRPGDELGSGFARYAKRNGITTFSKKAVRRQIRL